MNKTYKRSALWMMCLMFLGCLSFVACDNGDDEDTNQYKGGINLNVFGPCPVARGGELRFLGSGMDKITAVVLPGSGEITDIKKVSDTEIRVTVPQNAMPGFVVLNTPKGEITTKTKLTFTEPISLDAIAPIEVSPGDVITITGEYLNLIKEVIFADNVVVTEFATRSRKELQVKVPVEAKSGKIIISDGAEIPNWIYSDEELIVALPVYKSSSASKVKAGSALTITGENLDWVSAVRFEGAEVSEMEISKDAKTLTIVVPAIAQGGAVKLVSCSGVEVEAGKIGTILPTELKVAVESVKNGTDLAVIGKDMDLIVKATFPNVADGVALKEVSATKVVVTVPEAAQDGDIVFALANGETVAVAYKTLKPTIKSFMPVALTAGDNVTITGTDLDLVSAILFIGDGTPTVTIAKENFVNASTLKLTVPSVAETCAPKLTLKNGMTVETSVTLTIAPATDPVIATMPEFANPGQIIEITGKNLNYVEAFYFGETKVVYYEERTATSVKLQIPQNTPYNDYQMKMVSYAGIAFMSATKIKIQSPEWSLFEGNVAISWSDDAGKPRIYRTKAGGGLCDVGKLDLKVGSKLIFYYTTTADWFEIQVNNANWGGWGSIKPAADAIAGSAPVGKDARYEIELTDARLNDLLHLEDGWSATALILQGQGCNLTKVAVLP